MKTYIEQSNFIKRSENVMERERRQYTAVEKGLARARQNGLTLPHDVATCILVELRGEKIV